MKYVIAGLGNPGDAYRGTRHNAGAAVVAHFHDSRDFLSWHEGDKIKAFIANGKLGKTPVTLVLPQAFMNHSGAAVKPLVRGTGANRRLVVVHDDLDIPFGVLKISFGRSSGGHKGVESVIKSLGNTKEFIRLRVGVMPLGAGGEYKKPRGEKAVQDFILGRFTSSEDRSFPELADRAALMLESIVQDGYERAMNRYNTRGGGTSSL